MNHIEDHINRLSHSVENYNLTTKLVATVVLSFTVGLLDFFTGYELAFSLFYIIPVAFSSWFIGRRTGILTSISCAILWYLADDQAGHVYSYTWISFWNTLIRLSFFLIISLLLSKLNITIQHQTMLARMDGLTGAVNSRYFYVLAQQELNRFERYKEAFTLAYLDLDNFKTVNDLHGHHAGDEALRITTLTIQKHIRKTDTLARLGGDEFALLLPMTSQAEAQIVFSKLQTALLAEMKNKQWPITFSIGVVTCLKMPTHMDQLIKRADNLMYAVKKNGKNAVQYGLYE